MISLFIIKKYLKENDVKTPEIRTKIGKFSQIYGIFCNFLLFLGKLIAGIITQSVSIIADAINNVSDASGNFIAFFGFKMASRPADKEHPYGHGRYEYLSALTVAFLIMVIGAELMRSGIERIFSPILPVLGVLPIIILSVSIAVKLWMSVLYFKLSKIINSKTLLAASADSRNDVISTLAVLVSIIVSHYCRFDLDGYMAIAVALFILYSGFCLVKDTLNPLLGKAPDKDFVERIRLKILSYNGVLGTHDLMVHDYGAGRLFASVHVEVSAELDVVKAHAIIDDIERDFLKNDNLHLVIHLDPVPVKENDEIYAFIAEIVSSVDENLSFHDFKVEKREGKTFYIFDCSVPSDLKKSDEEIKTEINNALISRQNNCYCIITIDRNFVPVYK